VGDAHPPDSDIKINKITFCFWPSFVKDLNINGAGMNKSLLLGLWKFLVHIPRHIWQREVAQNVNHDQARLDFMTVDHQRVRDFVVLELPRRGIPLPPEEISSAMDLSLERTLEILDELEKGMTFLFRNERGEVAWAYPVTAEPTPHRIRFSTGEQIYAA
jgi:hypothetical protein